MQPVEMRKVTSAAQAQSESCGNFEAGTSHACVPLPYLSVLRMLKVVNAIDPSHAGKRRTCEDVRIGENGPKDWYYAHRQGPEVLLAPWLSSRAL